MSYVHMSMGRLAGVEVGYHAEYVSARSGFETRHPAAVNVWLGERREVYVALSIEDARALLAALPGVLAEHDAAQTDTTAGDGVDAGKAA